MTSQTRIRETLKYASCIDNNKNVVFLAVAVALALYVLALANPFSIPTIDDSAIVMRYLKNFQTGHFFAFNVEDGPVYGVSGFIYGLAAGTLCWIGLDPQPSIMIVSLLGTVGMFYCILRIAYYESKSVLLSISGTLIVYFSSAYLPSTLYLGLEVSINLWLVFACFLFFFEERTVALYLCGVLAIISKLDTLSLVSGLLILHLLRAALAGKIKSQVRPLLIFFVLPLLAWIAFSTKVFGSPLPESFLSKFYFREKAPRTSWFPFLEPMLGDHQQKVSVAIMVVAMMISPAIAVLRRRIFTPSLVMSAAAIGTLCLYWVYNPGEKMSWYYPLPETLMLLGGALCIFDAFKIQSQVPRLAITALSLCLVFVILGYRMPMNRGAIPNARYWQVVYEADRRDSGILANQVAPKDHPVLWSGHGYPAYEFNGYVADYSGLNTRAIWEARRAVTADTPEVHEFFQKLGIPSEPLQGKAEMYLVKMYDANVFMRHALFKESVQKALDLRLAGSFYNIDVAGWPAFRVFVKDPANAGIVRRVAIDEIKATGGAPKTGPLFVSADTISMPNYPGTRRLLFGVKITPDDQNLLIEDDAGKQIGKCTVAKIADPHFPDGARSCEIPLTVALNTKRLTIRNEGGGPITIFEPAFEYAAGS